MDEKATLNPFWPVPDARALGASSKTCPACLNADGNLSVEVPGDPAPARQTFRYCLCGRCGTLAIESVPDDLGAYYGSGYYSFAVAAKPAFIRWLKSRRDRYALVGQGLLGAALAKLIGGHRVLASLRPLFDGSLGVTLDQSSRILDIGCGAGTLLRELKDVGFSSLDGVDAFVPDPVDLPGLKIRQGTLADMPGHYDLIMLHHSFEHMPDPDVVLAEIKARLAPDGIALISIPLGASDAWRRYGGEWAQLDPPRHLHLFSAAGFTELAVRSGWRLLRTVYDSHADSFVWSEMRKRGISLHAPNKPAAPMSRRVLAGFAAEAGRLNATGEADQASFFLAPRK